FLLAGCDALLAGCVVAAGLLAGARRTPDPAGVGSRPMESREIALAARPTATARQSPTTARSAVRAVLVMATPSWLRPGRPPARAPARRWAGSAAAGAGAGAPLAGKRSSARVPPPGRALSVARAPQRCARASTMARPRPVPGTV